MTGKRIGLIGGRGFVGAELICLVSADPDFELVFASSASKVGEAIPKTNLRYCALKPDQIGTMPDVDALVLALPNGHTDQWLQAVQRAKRDLCLLDLSADTRFDGDWVYGLSEINTKQLKGAKRIANPGCYATAAGLVLHPIRDILAGAPSIFGLSGYSGAGATPNPKNDPANITDNIQPYCLIDHIHEREIGHHLGKNVHFSPHVAPFFRGISLTLHLQFINPQTKQDLVQIFRDFYAQSDQIQIDEDIPEIKQVRETPNTRIGGICVDESGEFGVIVVVLDNLLKGAASQAIQNLKLAL